MIKKEAAEPSAKTKLKRVVTKAKKAGKVRPRASGISTVTGVDRGAKPEPDYSIEESDRLRAMIEPLPKFRKFVSERPADTAGNILITTRLPPNVVDMLDAWIAERHALPISRNHAVAEIVAAALLKRPT